MASAIDIGVETGGGRYLLLEAIGQGGMGDVYKARDRQLDRIVAIKVVRPDASQDEDGDKRLVREARLAASLDHPFICKIHELIPHGDGQSLLVMEYVDGRTLKELLREGPIDAARVLRFAREIAEALGVAHRSQLIHRDIKPSNVMITTHGHVKVMDFGIAKSVSRPDASTTSTLTEAGRVVGTPAYMSPEQAAGRQIDARSDVFSFGVLIYECLTGERPYVEADSMINQADRFASPFRPLPAAIPVELRALVTRCLETRRDARFASFEAVRAALDTSTLLRVSVMSTDERPWIDGRSRRQLWLGATGLVVIAAVLGGWFWSRNRAINSEVLEQIPIVTWPTTEEGGRISPDGDKVMFVSIERGVSRLWIRSVAGSDPRPIGNPRETLKTPVWSPDGQQIGFLIRESDQAWLQVVKEWGELAGPPVSLGVPWRQAALVRWIGTQVYFSVSSPGSTDSVLWRCDTADRAVRQVTHESGKHFTSNGQLANVDINAAESRIVFEATGSGSRRLWIADLDGRNPQELAVRPNLVVTPRWRGPSGTRVIYGDNANGQNDIWEYDLLTKRSTALTTSSLEEAALDVSRSGDVIVADTLEESAHLWTVHPDRPDAPKQVTNDSRSDIWPSVSPTGRLLFHRGRGAFVGYIPTDTDLFTALWQDGRITETKRVVSGTSGVVSADGRRVAFLKWPEGQSATAELWVTDVDSVKPPVRLEGRLWFPGTNMSTWEPIGQTAAWSPRDSRTLFFVRQGTPAGFELVRVTLNADLTGQVEVVASEPRRAAGMDQQAFKDLAVSDDGSAIAFVVASPYPYRGARVMWLETDRPGAAARQILQTPDGTGVSIAAWTKRQTVVAVVSPNPEKGTSSQIVELSAAGATRPPIVESGLVGYTARVDSAGDRLVVTTRDHAAASVTTIGLRSGTRRTVVANDIEGIVFGGYAITPDGWLVYMRKEVNHNIWLFRLQPGNTTQDNPRR